MAWYAATRRASNLCVTMPTSTDVSRNEAKIRHHEARKLVWPTPGLDREPGVVISGRSVSARQHITFAKRLPSYFPEMIVGVI